MKIGVDIDGVIYDWVRDLRDYLIDEHGFEETQLPEPTRWEFWTDWDLSEDQFSTLVDKGIREGFVYNRGPEYAYPGAIEALTELHEVGHDLHLVTARPPLVLGATQSWLRESGIPFDSLTFAENKTVVPVDMFIEDNLDHARAIKSAGTASFVMDRPWNQSDDFDGWRLGDWDLVPTLVEVMERRKEEGRPPYGPGPAVQSDGLDRSFERTSSTGGVKGVKPERLSLIPHEALLPIARVYAHGERKYAANNWRKGYPWSWSLDALERHVGAFKTGEDLDPESGEPHLAHAAFHIFALLTWAANPDDQYEDFDDRYRVGD